MKRINSRNKRVHSTHWAIYDSLSLIKHLNVKLNSILSVIMQSTHTRAHTLVSTVQYSKNKSQGQYEAFLYVSLPLGTFTWACLEDSWQRRGLREGLYERRLNRLILIAQIGFLEGGEFGSRKLGGR